MGARVRLTRRGRDGTSATTDEDRRRPARGAVRSRMGGSGAVQLHARRRRRARHRPRAARGDVRRSRRDRRPAHVPRRLPGRRPLGPPAPHPGRPRRPGRDRRREDPRLERGTARRAQERRGSRSLPGHAPGTRPRVPSATLGSAGRDRRPFARGRDRGDAPPGRRDGVGALPRRRPGGAPPVHAGRAHRGHDGR